MLAEGNMSGFPFWTHTSLTTVLLMVDRPLCHFSALPLTNLQTIYPTESGEKGKNGTDCKAVTKEAIDFRVELMKVQSALTEPWQLQRNYIEHFALVAIRLEIKCVK